MDVAKGTLDELDSEAIPGEKMSEEHACMYAWKMAEALGYCHSILKVIHRDLHENNVLIEAEACGEWVYKFNFIPAVFLQLADFCDGAVMMQGEVRSFTGDHKPKNVFNAPELRI